MKKNGFGLIGLLLAIAILGVGGIYGFQIGTAYLNKSVISKAIKDTLINNADNPDISNAKLKKEIMEKLSLSDLDFSEKDIVVNRVGKSITVDAEYSKRIGLTDSISILLDFEISESSN